MNKLLLASLVMLSGLATAAQTPAGAGATQVVMEAHVERAKVAIKEFAGRLKAELQQAMKAGGPVNAIAVCHTEAGGITRDASTQHGLTLSRVSARNRNPGNAPNNWQADVLERFEARKRDGEPVAELVYAEIVDQGGEREFRFMKAIPTQPVCLNCHGSELQQEVRDRLSQLYPQDKATGFAVGDIRGAFVVTKMLQE